LEVKTAEVATPEALVVAVVTPPAKLPLAPLAGTAKVTIAPATGLLPASFTVACRVDAKAVLITAVCGVPPVAVMLKGLPEVLVSAKFAAALTPATLAVTVYAPAVALEVKTAEVATPDALVVAVVTPPAKPPLAPLPGAAKVTVAPPTGLPPESVTVACKVEANAVLIAALCGVPPVDVMWAGVPGFTVKVAVACWIPVCTVMVLGPVAAALLMLMFAVALVGLLTVRKPEPPAAAPATEIPGPKLAEVIPWEKLV
jgi:hypothetical protein